MSWSSISLLLALLTFLLAILILTLVPDLPMQKKHISWSEHLNGLRHVYGDRYFWKLAPLVMAIGGTITAFQCFAVSPFLLEVVHSTKAEISYILLAMGIAMIISNPIGSILNSILPNKTGKMEAIIGGGALIAIIFQVFIVLQIIPGSMIFWGFYTLFAIFIMMTYSLISIHFPPHYVGRATTGMNILFFLSSFLLQYLFGIIAKGWTDLSTGLIATFWIFIALQALSLIWFMFGKCQAYEK